MAAQRAPDRAGPFAAEHWAWLALPLVAALRGPRAHRPWAWAALGAVAMVLAWPRLQSHYFFLPIPLLAIAAIGLWPALESGRRRHWAAAALVAGVLAIPIARAIDRRPVQQQAAAEMRALAAQVARLAGSPTRPIWGDGALVPLVSLHTGLPVALGDTDVNAQRFAAGLLDAAAHVDKVLATRPILVVVPRHGVDTIAAIHDAMLRRCPDAQTFTSPATGYAGVLLTCR
ncbi:MAG: hypothetical protein FJ100_08330 [Deltaproteobacteria bacterium]|nr:hypothetical protein [Deltaproteobacteria bacterium]